MRVGCLSSARRKKGSREMVTEKSGQILSNQVEFKVTGCQSMMDFPHFLQNEKTYCQIEISP